MAQIYFISQICASDSRVVQAHTIYNSPRVFLIQINHHLETLSNKLTEVKLRHMDKKVSEYDQEIPSSIPTRSHTFYRK